MTRAERRKYIESVLANRTPSPAQVEAEKRSAKSQRARRKGEAFQERIATDLLRIGKQIELDEWDTRSRAVSGHGEDIMFSPPAWNRFGRPWIECKHYRRKFNIERVFDQHAQKCHRRDKPGYEGIPIVVHRCNHQPILATMREVDLIALGGQPPESALRTGELVTVAWQDVLQVLARKVAAGGPLMPSVEPVLDAEDMPPF